MTRRANRNRTAATEVFRVPCHDRLRTIALSLAKQDSITEAHLADNPIGNVAEERADPVFGRPVPGAERIDHRNGIDFSKRENPTVELSWSQIEGRYSGQLKQSKQRDTGVDARQSVDEALVVGMEGVAWKEPIDDEYVAIEQDQSGPL